MEFTRSLPSVYGLRFGAYVRYITFQQPACAALQNTDEHSDFEVSDGSPLALYVQFLLNGWVPLSLREFRQALEKLRLGEAQRHSPFLNSVANFVADAAVGFET